MDGKAVKRAYMIVAIIAHLTNHGAHRMVTVIKRSKRITPSDGEVCVCFAFSP